MSRLLGDPVYESLARRAVQSLWTIRNNDTGLFGTNMNIQSGQWISNMSGMFYGYVQRVIRREGGGPVQFLFWQFFFNM